MTLFCPTTGFKVFTIPEWINQEASNVFTANFWIINDSIIYSLPKGYAERYLSPVELLSEEAWNIQTPEFSNRVVLIDQSILHSTSEGYLESKHIPQCL